MSYTHAAVSPTGKWCILLDNTNQLVLHDIFNERSDRYLWLTVPQYEKDFIQGLAILRSPTPNLAGVHFAENKYRWLFSCDKDGTTVLWDAENGTIRQTYQGTPAPIYYGSNDSSPDRKFFLSTQANTVRLFDINTQTLLKTFRVSTSPVRDANSVSFSPCGNFFAAGFGNQIHLCKIDIESPPKDIELPLRMVSSLICADASCGSNNIMLLSHPTHYLCRDCRAQTEDFCYWNDIEETSTTSQPPAATSASAASAAPPEPPASAQQASALAPAAAPPPRTPAGDSEEDDWIVVEKPGQPRKP